MTTAASTNLYKIHISLDSEILGTAPSDPNIYSDFIASKKFQAVKELSKKGKLTEEEQAAYAREQDELTKEELEALPADTEKGVTVFRRHPVTKSLILPDFMLKGFLKEAASAIGDGNGKTWGLTSKIDKWVFITDENRKPVRYIPMTRDGVELTQPDRTSSRPLRAQTMQGQRVSLACSEVVNSGELDFYVYVLPLGAGEKHKLDEATLKAWFEYGVYCGLGQWRSGGNGRFTATVTAV